MALTIYTYGGGNVLSHVFDSIAILTNATLFHSLIVVGMSFGAFWVIVKSFFSFSMEMVFLRFFLPSIVITSLLMLPKSTVHIEDAYTNAPHKVDHVPWLIAKPVELISTLGYKITDAIENIMHVPNDLKYNKTGMVFGSETALDMRKYQISDAVLEQNLKKFSQQCVFYDLALNKYSLNQLKKTTDLWKFLESNTSKVRMIPYSDPNNQKENVYLSCQNAVKAMRPIFEKEKQYHASQDLVKHLGLTFQALSGIQKEKSELISQQLMMQLLDGELGSNSFAKSRTYMQQKSTYHILGSLASNSLITIRAIMEALLYASVIVIIPMSVLPGGFSFIANWAWMLVWIQLWPPFYAIVNYIMQVIAQGKAQAIFMNLSSSEKGLSFFTNAGLANLHEDMFAMSGYLAILVPIISYAIVRGGVSSFMQLSGSLMNPGQSAAAAAAAEQATGNYSFANASFGQTSYENSSAFQQNMAPSFSSGFFTDNSGNLSTRYTTGGETILAHSSSELRWGVSSDSAITESFQKAQQTSNAFTESQQKSYMESLGSHSRNMWDLSSHLSKSENFSENLSTQEAANIQESANFVKNIASSHSKQFGITEQESLSMMLGGNIPFVGGCNYGRNSNNTEAVNDALNISKGEDFQRHVQNISNFAKQQAYGSLNDEGIRLADSTSKSIDEVSSSQQQFQIAKNRSEQISETASWASQNTHLIRKAMNQDLVNWAVENTGFQEAKRILTNGSNEEKSALMNSFIESIHLNESKNTIDPDRSYASSMIQTVDRETALNSLNNSYFESAHQNGFSRGDMSERKDEMQIRVSNGQEHVLDDRQNAQEIIKNKEYEANIESYLNEKAPHRAPCENPGDYLMRPLDIGSDLLNRLYDGPVNHSKFSEKYNKDQPPLGWNQ